jgi:flavin-dependent dehydrogenase
MASSQVPHLRSNGNASAWSTAELVRRDAFSAPLGGGWHIDRTCFEQLLEERARHAGVQLCRGWEARGVRPAAAGGWSVHGTVDGRADRACGRVLVDATGHQATIAQWVGARRQVHDRLVCTYCTLRGNNTAALAGWTLIEAAREGWWYAAPLPGGRAVAALFTDPRTCHAARHRDPDGWQRAWHKSNHLRSMLGPMAAPDRLDLAAVTPHHLDRAAGSDWIAVGDAAATLDPLASAGITLALRDGTRAAASIAALRAGARAALTAYTESLQRRFAKHLVGRAAYYGLERRWPDAHFWADRRTLQLTANAHAVLFPRGEPPQEGW